MAKQSKVKAHSRAAKGKGNTTVKQHVRKVKKPKKGGSTSSPDAGMNFYQRMLLAKQAKAVLLKKAARKAASSNPTPPSPQSL